MKCSNAEIENCDYFTLALFCATLFNVLRTEGAFTSYLHCM